MISISILEEKDRVRADDWIRPLDFRTNGWSDEVLRFSPYSGRPDNHCKWVRVGDVLGKCWFGKTAGQDLPECEVWHEGRCGRCGRKLTVPESIETGIGPDCAKR